jgi:hypothetical protein
LDILHLRVGLVYSVKPASIVHPAPQQLDWPLDAKVITRTHVEIIDEEQVRHSTLGGSINLSCLRHLHSTLQNFLQLFGLAVTGNVKVLSDEVLLIHAFLGVSVDEFGLSCAGRSDQHHMELGVYQSIDKIAVSDSIIRVPKVIKEHVCVLLEVQ